MNIWNRKEFEFLFFKPSWILRTRVKDYGALQKKYFEEITKMNHVYKQLQQLKLLQSSISQCRSIDKRNMTKIEEHENESLFMHIWNSLIVSNLPDPWAQQIEADIVSEMNLFYKWTKMNHVYKQLKQLRLFQSSISQFKVCKSTKQEIEKSWNKK